MYFDLNIPIATPAALAHLQTSQVKKKGKQKATAPTLPTHLFTDEQIGSFERRIDVLVHLGYKILALNQTIQTSFQPTGHVNYLEEIVTRLKKREGIIFLKRLTIVLNEESETGTGLSKQNNTTLLGYDILSLQPTTQSNFSVACLKHSSPSSLTAHIISIPLTGPRLPFFFKHTLVRTAIKNGCVFEIPYSPALGSGEVERRNWWANSRELTRVTQGGKGVILSSGSNALNDLRAPGDISNIAVMLGFASDESKNALSATAKAMLIRAHTRKTHLAILSEPVIIQPPADEQGKAQKRQRTDDSTGEDNPSKKSKH